MLVYGIVTSNFKLMALLTHSNWKRLVLGASFSGDLLALIDVYRPWDNATVLISVLNYFMYKYAVQRSLLSYNSIRIVILVY